VVTGTCFPLPCKARQNYLIYKEEMPRFVSPVSQPRGAGRKACQLSLRGKRKSSEEAGCFYRSGAAIPEAAVFHRWAPRAAAWPRHHAYRGTRAESRRLSRAAKIESTSPA